MAVGTGATLLEQVPGVQFVTDPGSFFALTSKQVNPIPGIAHPGAGQAFARQLPQVGVKSKLRITFSGTLTVATAAVTTSKDWPYNLLKNFKLSVNGQNDLFNCTGVDLTVLRDLRYPAFIEAVQAFAGTIGGGDSVGTGTTTLYLSWEVPIAMDDVSLIGALFAQSSSTNITAQCTIAANTDLFSANPGNATITGTWTIEETFFEVPFGAQGELIVPDLSRLHGFNAFDTPFTATGDATAKLIRSDGQLMRLLVRADHSATARLSADPSAASSRKIDAIRLEYGGNKRPYVFNPAASLREVNNQHYGGPALYDFLVFDFAKENPARDAVIMLGTTELQTVVTVNSGVTVSAGQLHPVQETLY